MLELSGPAQCVDWAHVCAVQPGCRVGGSGGLLRAEATAAAAMAAGGCLHACAYCRKGARNCLSGWQKHVE